MQRKFTKYLPSHSMSYTETLELLTLNTLEFRRLENDLVFLYKMVYNLVDVNCHKHFFYNVMRTRGHNLKINVPTGQQNSK